MNRNVARSLTALVVLALAFTTACGGESTDSPDGDGENKNGNGHGHSHDNGHEHEDHGAEFDLGTQQVGPYEVRVVQTGPVTKEHELVFDVITTPADAAAVRAWFGGSDRTLHTVARGHKEGPGWHLHLEPLDALDPAWQLHVEVEDTSGQSHHAHFDTRWAGPNDGIVGKLRQAGNNAGWIEVKLHDDEGDIEVWLAHDRTMQQPLDLPLDTTITIAFAEQAREIHLAVRDRETNPDEDGNPTIRNGRTNYFIFPGDTGADPSWLKGEEFRATITVTIPTDQGAITSEAFPLVPHAHDHHDHHGH